jgi:hypothetical protein
MSSLIPSDWWSNNIPSEVQEAIGNAVRQQILSLPANLFVEWHEPKFLERRWFQEASRWIEIPYPEYWQ